MVFALLVFFAATGWAVFVLRRARPGAGRPFRTPGYPLVPAVFILVCLAIFASIVFAQPLKSAAGLLLLGAGLPAYFVWSRRRLKEAGKVNKGVGREPDLN
jgi:APA family basic amino acid/polyamine antiporter